MISSKTGSLPNQDVEPLEILVVDDDDLNRRMMHILLTRDGHHVDLACNGMDALDAVKYHKFDIVFMDLQMPVMDGIEASRRIREWENGGTHTYIVALTASYLPEQGQTLFDAGIDNYIAKPFEVEHIKRMLGLISSPPHRVLVHTDPAQTNPSAEHEILDIKKGTQRVGGDTNTYHELLRDFIEELSKRIEGMEHYLLDRNMDALSREAHNLKGVSSNLGAMELAECASQLDKESNEGYTHRHEGLFLELKKAEKKLLRTANEFLLNHGRLVAQS
ncbi:MAG TPA: response regulator [Anaerolineales bacterium]|nr:response regulator [Anaerolineales bacterium]